MKKLTFSLLTVCLLFCNNLTVFSGEVEESIQKMARELESKYPGRTKVKVALLQFRTSDNKLTGFNQFIQDEIVDAFKNSQRIEIIDPNAMNRIVESFGWSLDKSLSFKAYNDLGELIFRNLGIAADAFIYGQIADNDESITLTGYIVPGGMKSTNIQSLVRFASSEQTDKLLGKPVRIRPTINPKIDTVVVYKEKIVEKPIYVEKEVVVEKPVYVEKNQTKETPQPSNLKATLGNLEITIEKTENVGGKIVFTVTLLNNVEDQKLPVVSARFFDSSGNEFESSQNTMTWVSIIAGVPSKKTITFEGNTNSVDLIRVLEIEFNQTGKVQIKNIPVTK